MQILKKISTRIWGNLKLEEWLWQMNLTDNKWCHNSEILQNQRREVWIWWGTQPGRMGALRPATWWCQRTSNRTLHMILHNLPRQQRRLSHCTQSIPVTTLPLAEHYLGACLRVNSMTPITLKNGKCTGARASTQSLGPFLNFIWLHCIMSFDCVLVIV